MRHAASYGAPGSAGWEYWCPACGDTGKAAGIRPSTTATLEGLRSAIRHKLTELRDCPLPAEDQPDTAGRLLAGVIILDVLHAIAGMPQLTGTEASELAKLALETEDVIGERIARAKT